MSEGKEQLAVFVTVGFKCRDRAAFDAFWGETCKAYRFAEDVLPDTPVRAFAVSMGNMFEEQDVVDAILASDLDPFEMKEAIAAVPCCPDLRKLCAEWEIAHPYDAPAAPQVSA